MKKSILVATVISLLFASGSLSGCAARALEEEINVVFVNEGQIVDSGTVTQFKNYQSPTISDAYIPTNYRFLGWTGYEESQLDLKDVSHFKSQYIGGGRMIHYMDVKQFAVNSTVTLQALIMHKDDIPKEYHYAVVAWYDKAGTSGMVDSQIEQVDAKLKEYLLSDGVSEDDVNSVLFRGYTGNVGTSTGQILYDDDVDIMLGWGSLSNITTTGSIPEESVLQSEVFAVTYGGEVKNRYLHRLSDSEGAIKVTNFLLTDEVKAIFN